MSDGLAVPVYEYVTLVEAGSSTWPLWVNTHYHHAQSFIPFDGDGLKAKPKITARNSPVLRELWRNPLDGGCWDDEHTSPRPKNRHADRRPGHVDHKAAFGGLR
jgi:hypothetical protein